MEYPFLIDDALKAGKGAVTATTQTLLQEYALKEGATKEEFISELQKKSAFYYQFKREIIESDQHKCPSCGANIPVISQICSYCSAELNIAQHIEFTEDELIKKIENINYNIGSIPNPSFFRVFLSSIYIIFPILAVLIGIFMFGKDTLMQGLWQSSGRLEKPAGEVVFEITRFISDNMFFFMPLFAGGGLLAILIKIVMVFARRKKRITLNLCRAEYERISNLARIYYKNNTKINEELKWLQNNIITYASKRNLQSTFTSMILIIFIGILGWYSTFFIDFGVRSSSFNPDDYVSEEKIKPASEYQDEYARTHFMLRALDSKISGPLSPYLELDKGEYIAFQKPGTYREDLYLNNLQFTVKKTYNKTLDSTQQLYLHFGVLDKDGNQPRYADSSIIIGFYYKYGSSLPLNLKKPGSKLLLHFNGMLSYREDSIPSNLSKELVGFKVESSISRKY